MRCRHRNINPATCHAPKVGPLVLLGERGHQAPPAMGKQGCGRCALAAASTAAVAPPGTKPAPALQAPTCAHLCAPQVCAHAHIWVPAPQHAAASPHGLHLHAICTRHHHRRSRARRNVVGGLVGLAVHPACSARRTQHLRSRWHGSPWVRATNHVCRGKANPPTPLPRRSGIAPAPAPARHGCAHT